jgi:hypothetical protein
MGIRGIFTLWSRCSAVKLTFHLHTAPRSEEVKLSIHYLDKPYSYDEGQLYFTFDLLKTALSVLYKYFRVFIVKKTNIYLLQIIRSIMCTHDLKPTYIHL